MNVRHRGPPRYHDDALLTVADAARLSRRSVRTLRRAYLSGRLTPHRVGNGRGLSIRFADLHAWLTAQVIAPMRQPRGAVGAQHAVARRDDLEPALGLRERRRAGLAERAVLGPGERPRALAQDAAVVALVRAL